MAREAEFVAPVRRLFLRFDVAAGLPSKGLGEVAIVDIANGTAIKMKRVKTVFVGFLQD